jgi:hypothetical protein
MGRVRSVVDLRLHQHGPVLAREEQLPPGHDCAARAWDVRAAADRTERRTTASRSAAADTGAVTIIASGWGLARVRIDPW